MEKKIARYQAVARLMYVHNGIKVARTAIIQASHDCLVLDFATLWTRGVRWEGVVCNYCKAGGPNPSHWDPLA